MTGKSKVPETVFDRKDLLERLEGDLELARQIGEMFIEDAGRILSLIKERMACKDADGVMRAAHSLKGSSANLSAFRLQSAAAELEQAAEQQSLARAEQILPRLEQEFKGFEDELRRYILE